MIPTSIAERSGGEVAKRRARERQTTLNVVFWPNDAEESSVVAAVAKGQDGSQSGHRSHDERSAGPI